MGLPQRIRKILPHDTAETWEAIADLVPDPGYLAGGTALAVHLAHRTSRDLDFFLSQPIDVESLRRALEKRGPFHVTGFDGEPGSQTLNGVFNATTLQFLEASSETVLEPFTAAAGVRVAGLGDLLANKLKVLLDRPELRDYYDLRCLEEQAGRRVEEGLSLAVLKYSPTVPDQFMLQIVRALGSYDDVEEDPALPMGRDQIEAYWRTRLPEIVTSLSRQE